MLPLQMGKNAILVQKYMVVTSPMNCIMVVYLDYTLVYVGRVFIFVLVKAPSFQIHLPDGFLRWMLGERRTFYNIGT